VPKRVTIFSDAQAAIKRIASDEPGPGQQCALQERKHIAALRRARQEIIIEIQWCPAHRGVAGNEKADEWAKTAAEEPDTHGVEWLSYDYDSQSEVWAMPLPRSLANLKREISEKKWVEAEPPRRNTGYRKTRSRTARLQETKRLASRFYQLKMGTLCPGNTSTGGRTGPPRSACGVGTESDLRAPLQGVPRVEATAGNPVGGG